jgi:hypothetical protein
MGGGQKWYASPDVATVMEQTVVGGTAQDYSKVGTLSEAVGAYLTIGAAEFLTVDGDRLVYAGHYTDASLKSTVGWTPPGSDPVSATPSARPSSRPAARRLRPRKTSTTTTVDRCPASSRRRSERGMRSRRSASTARSARATTLTPTTSTW